MKTKILTGVFLASLILLASCDSWIDSGLNTDPTAPKDVSLNVLLPSAQAAMSYVIGGDNNRQLSLITQHFTGTDRQHLGMYGYSFDESSFENAWVTMYTGPMLDCYIMIEKCKENQSPYYQGIAEFLMAYSIGMWTDMLGDIPYSECFKGNANLTPKYDKQQDLYASMHKLLDDAIAHCGASASTFKPTGDDFIYSGNMTAWIKAAYTLKARLYLHQKNYQAALDALANGFTDNADDLQFNHGLAESEANPLYQFINQRGDISIGGHLIDMMNSMNDPRRPFYADKGEAEEYTSEAAIGPYYSQINSPVPFITFAEALFIKAECQFQLGNKAGAFTSYIDAIKASCLKFGVDAADVDTYVAQASVDLGGEANLTLKAIMEQKYIALFFQSESWTDYRRTGFPALAPTKGDKVPRRMFYPQSERLFNGTNLMNAAPGYNQPSFIFTEVWWDSLW